MKLPRPCLFEVELKAYIESGRHPGIERGVGKVGSGWSVPVLACKVFCLPVTCAGSRLGSPLGEQENLVYSWLNNNGFMWRPACVFWRLSNRVRSRRPSSRCFRRCLRRWLCTCCAFGSCPSSNEIRLLSSSEE